MKLGHTIKLLAAALITSLAFSSQALASNERTYQVTITNITQAVIFTPIIGVTHNSSVSLFELGQPPSAELATIAEGGNTAPLEASLNGVGAVGSTSTAGGPLPAGQTTEFQITAKRYTRLFSMAGMLLPTNDAFVAVDGVYLPFRGSRSYYAKAYDAGSEVNDQLCANIPGPQCGGDGAFTGISGEGFVHIHNGIHEQGDLPNGGSATYDWRNPVALVTITRIK